MVNVGRTHSDAIHIGIIGYKHNEIIIETIYSGQDVDTEIAIFDANGNKIEDHDDIDYPRNKHSRITISGNSADYPPGDYYIAAGIWNTEYGTTNFDITAEVCDEQGGCYIQVTTHNNDTITTNNNTTFNYGQEVQFWLKFTILDQPIAAQSCFRRGSLIKTDQGNLKIENIVAGYNTINNNIIKRVTQSYNSDGVIVKVDKNSLGENKPENDLYMQKDHKLLISPFDFASLLSTNKISFLNSDNEEILYNILLDSQETMKVNNIEVETLNPDLLVSKYFMKPSTQLKDKIENNTIKIPIV